MLNFDRDQLLMLKDSMETLKRWFVEYAENSSAITKQRAINDSVRCDRILDAIEEELNTKD